MKANEAKALTIESNDIGNKLYELIRKKCEEGEYEISFDNHTISTSKIFKELDLENSNLKKELITNGYTINKEISNDNIPLFIDKCYIAIETETYIISWKNITREKILNGYSDVFYIGLLDENGEELNYEGYTRKLMSNYKIDYKYDSKKNAYSNKEPIEFLIGGGKFYKTTISCVLLYKDKFSNDSGIYSEIRMTTEYVYEDDILRFNIGDLELKCLDVQK